MLAQSQVSGLTFYHDLPPCASSLKSYSAEFAKHSIAICIVNAFSLHAAHT